MASVHAALYRPITSRVRSLSAVQPLTRTSCVCHGKCPKCRGNSEVSKRSTEDRAAGGFASAHSFGRIPVRKSNSSASSRVIEGRVPPPEAEPSGTTRPEGVEETTMPEEAPTNGVEGESKPESVCDPTPLKRSEFLAHPATKDDQFGLTKLDPVDVTYPELQLLVTEGGVTLRPTTAALPTILSVYTGVDRFMEGEMIQSGDGDCPGGRYPVQWFIHPKGAAKIGAGEQEHCDDFQYAFEISLARYTHAVNLLASTRQVFKDREAANAALTREVGVKPDDWPSVFGCLARKTEVRDDRGWHTPRSRTTPPMQAWDCKYGREYVGGDIMPEVGKHPPNEIIKDCT